MDITKRLEFLWKFVGSSLAVTLTNMTPPKKTNRTGVLEVEDGAFKLKRKKK
jgi:hypothetical protein